MPAQRDRLLFKYTGENGEHLMGIPNRDIMESDRHWLSDEQMALLGQAAFYRSRNDADEVVAEAAKRVEKAEIAAGVVTDMTDIPSGRITTQRPQGEAKK